MAGVAPDSIRRNAVFALAVQLTTAAFTAAVTLYLVRALDPEGFGRFSLALAIVGLLTLPSDLGITPAAARFVAEHRGDRAAAAAFFADALRLKLAAAGVIAVLLFAFASPVAGVFGDPELVWPLRGLAVALLGQSTFYLASGIFVALGRIRSNLGVVFSESAVEASATVALVALGGGAAGAAFGRATGYVFGAAVGIVIVARMLGARRRLLRGGGRARRIAGYAGSLAIVDWAFTAFEQLDALLIGLLLSTTSVGLFQAPVRFIAFLHYPGYALANAVAPRLAREDGRPPDSAAFTSTLRLILILQALMVAPVVVWADPIVALLLGDGYEESADVLRALAPYVYLSGIAPLVSLAANYLGEGRRRPRIALATLAVNAVIDIALLREIGIVAAAIGTNVAFTLYVVAHHAICIRALGLSWRPSLVTVVRSLAAAAAAAGVLAAFGTGELSAADWLLGGTGAVAAFAAVLVATGEVRPSELAALLRLRRSPRRRD